jgi:L-amino acid N-acyltransferase YncA
MATADDLPYIVEVYNTTIPSGLVTADLQPVTVEEKQNWFDGHDPETRPLWIVAADDEKAGWMSFRSFYGRPAYVGTVEISVYLHPSYRGKGIGKRCLQMAREQAPRYAVHTLLAFIFGHNLPSLKLFTDGGFAEWGRLPEVADMRGVKRDLVILGCKV